MAALRRLPRRLSRSEWRDLGRAQLAVLVAHAQLILTPRGRFATPASPAAPLPAAPHELLRARALLRAVRRVSRYGLTRPYCLVRAVALLRLLRADGIAGASLRIGVRKDEGVLRAHAWVELHGVALDVDVAALDAYVQLPGVALAALARQDRRAGGTDA